MRTIRYGIAGGVLTAGLSYFGTQALDAAITPSAESINEDIEQCAHALGNLPLSRTVLPVACEEFDYTFDYTEHKITSNEDGSTSSTLQVFFETPSGDEFLDENLIDPDVYNAAEADERESAARFSAAFGGFFGFMIGVNTARAADKEERKPQTI